MEKARTEELICKNRYLSGFYLVFSCLSVVSVAVVLVLDSKNKKATSPLHTKLLLDAHSSQRVLRVVKSYKNQAFLDIMAL